VTITENEKGAAENTFIDVLMKAADAQRPGRIGADHGTDLDRASALEAAVEAATRYCDEGLLSLMKTFQSAVIELTMGGGSEGEVRTARDKFTAGCRVLLGNDQ
jgi:hypothetical protein